MRTIARISDLHFGAHDPAVVAALEERLGAARPDLVSSDHDIPLYGADGFAVTRSRSFSRGDDGWRSA